jgi:signal transduction histidine kinase
MEEIIEFFRNIFAHNLWPARWHCGRWTGFHGWLYIISDLAIWAAYYAIPVIIIGYTAKRKNVKFQSVYFLFAAFILACGTTHLIDAITFWYPVYRLNALVRFFTAVVSWATVYYLIKVIPIAFTLKTAEQLEVEVEARKKTEEELLKTVGRLNEAQEIARMGDWEWNVQADTVTWSTGLFKLYEIPVGSRSFSIKDFVTLAHPDDVSFLQTTLARIKTENKFPEFYFRIKTANGEVKLLYAKGEVLLSGEGANTRVIGTLQDLTHQSRLEQQLIEKTRELERTNADLERFAYAASHDLKQPLRKISMYGNMLKSEIETSATSEKQIDFLQKILDGMKRMNLLIDDILTFSNVNARDINFETCDLNKVYDAVLSDLEVQLQENGAVVTKDGNLPVIEANAIQMGQVFQNLVSNAVKFKSSERPPEIHISYRSLKGNDVSDNQLLRGYYNAIDKNGFNNEDFVELTFSDNGIGFEAKYAERIFTVFERLDTQSTQGSGVGLSICKKIVENHHGVIWATGVVDKGATFTIILPVNQGNFQ